MKRYLIGVFIVFLAIAGTILLLAGRSNRGDKQPERVATQQKQLYDYASSSDAKAVYTLQGHIVGDDEYRSIRITVARDYRRIDVLAGYTDRVIKSKTFENDQAAFDVFLRALDHANYTKTRKTDITDERGVCPIGYRYIYAMKDGDTEVQRTWSTSCGGKFGTSATNADTVRRLFQRQITDYRHIVSGVNLF